MKKNISNKWNDNRDDITRGMTCQGDKLLRRNARGEGQRENSRGKCRNGMRGDRPVEECKQNKRKAKTEGA